MCVRVRVRVRVHAALSHILFTYFLKMTACVPHETFATDFEEKLKFKVVCVWVAAGDEGGNPVFI